MRLLDVALASREWVTALSMHRRKRACRSDIRDAGELEKALNRAVLAVFSVQDGEHHADFADRTGAVRLEETRPAVLRSGERKAVRFSGCSTHVPSSIASMPPE